MKGRRREDGAGRPCGRAEAYEATSRSETGWRNPIPATPMAARSFGVVREDRRREDGAGRPCGRAEGLSGQPRDRDRQAKSDPGNAGWQRDLSVSLNKVGDVKTAQGDLAGALRPTRTASRSPTGWRNPIPATPAGSAIFRCRLERRRREDGARRPCGRAQGQRGQPRDLRPAGEIRSRQRRLAARSFRVVERSAT